MFSLSIQEAFSAAGDGVNDDVTGHRGNAAWVIDGATDIGDGPLVGGASDAAWLAATIGAWLETSNLPARLEDAIPELTAHAASAFEAARRRAPTGRFEHPSAAGVIVRLEGRELACLALGDCSLVVGQPGGDVMRYGIADEAEAGDAWLAEQLRAAAGSRREREAAGRLAAGPISEETSGAAGLLAILRAARAYMNVSPGYGVFSITAPPADYIVTERVPVATGTRILIASDGFMRLVDVFQRYTLDDLLAATFERGIVAMVDELRELERGDGDCLAFPRAKCSDDASAVIGEIR